MSIRIRIRCRRGRRVIVVIVRRPVVVMVVVIRRVFFPDVRFNDILERSQFFLVERVVVIVRAVSRVSRWNEPVRVDDLRRRRRRLRVVIVIVSRVWRLPRVKVLHSLSLSLFPIRCSRRQKMAVRVVRKGKIFKQRRHYRYYYRYY
jgi:hypothetical protein